MFWADRIAQEVMNKFGPRGPVLIRDEKTPSGRVHVGSMRGVAIHGAISEALNDRGVPNVFKYEFNDLDPMDGFPEYLPEEFRQYMGMPLSKIPSPEVGAANFADYFAQEFKNVIVHAGFSPVFYNVSELYLEGKMDDAIRVALDHAAEIRRIYREVSGSQKPDDWYPLSVFCESCGKVGTTQVFAWDGSEVSYRCAPDAVKWAKGCGHEGKISPFGGKAKFPFKVEWPAKWKVLGVMVEGAGKDHSTKGGARDVAAHIAKEVFAHEAPMDAPYEFFLVGGKKMSSSKGRGSSAREIAELVPPKILRLALLGKDINQAINFDPEGDTIPVLYDHYDKLAENFWAGTKDDYARLFEFIHPGRAIPERSALPRFSQVAFVVQMPHMDLYQEFPDANRAELDERATYAKRWLEAYAPEKYVYKLHESVPDAAKNLTSEQKAALKTLAEFIEAGNPSAEELHTKLHESKQFKAIYFAFLGKDSGPKAGWFLASLPRELVLQRLREVSQL
jgi:lysyl-tRNA synthetase class 1